MGETAVSDHSSTEVGKIDPIRGILPQIFPPFICIAIYNFLLIKALLILAKMLLRSITGEENVAHQEDCLPNGFQRTVL
jgi:hypothetical protein